MKLKRKEAIKQLKEGKIQIYNDLLPSTKEIEKLLKEAFPEDKGYDKWFIEKKYFAKHHSSAEEFQNKWCSYSISRNLPIINISTIIKQKRTTLEKTFSKTLKEFDELKKDVAGVRQIIAKDVEVDAEEVKSELIVGKWYKNAESLFCVKSIKNENVEAYGFDSGVYLESGTFPISCSKEDVLASPEEVEQALIAEAKKRGFEMGVWFKDIVTGQKEIIEGNYKYFSNNCLKHLNHCIFKDGIWAEILEQPKDEIDWDVPQIVKCISKDKIVATNGKHNDSSFEGILLISDNNIQSVNSFCEFWAKECFTKFKGTLKINQE